jgi:hypothetical protein
MDDSNQTSTTDLIQALCDKADLASGLTAKFTAKEQSQFKLFERGQRLFMNRLMSPEDPGTIKQIKQWNREAAKYGLQSISTGLLSELA